ncbi:hypothetical protein BH09VER1_BH09VER1_09650 [soil metagenome]
MRPRSLTSLPILSLLGGAVIFFATPHLVAQSYWINPAGGDIANAANWSGTIPSSTQDGYFTLSSAYTVNVVNDFTAQNLGFFSGTVTVDLAAGKTLALANGGGFGSQGGAIILNNSGTLLAAGGAFGTDLGGSVTINNASVLAGLVAIGTGRITQNSGFVQTGDFMVANGSGASGRYDMSGGQLLVTGTALDGSGGSLRVGDFGGSGTFNQTGGLVQLTTSSTQGNSLNIGNQGGTGVYNISSGTLGFSGAGLVTLGRSADSNPAGSGVLNISGNALVDISGTGSTAQFIIGDNVSSTNNGYGIVNQTSGTLSIHDGANLYLSGFAPTISGTNTYNLLGGVLAIGGSSLKGSYNGSSPYAFNLGGATIRVTGTDLTTSVNVTLVSGSSSAIDTNGLNATWTGTITGTNSQLVKMGAGNLAISANNTIASFFVTGGSVSQASGTTTSSEVGVGSGLTGTTPNVGVYNMTGGTLQIAAGTPPPIVGGSASSFRVGDFGGSGTFNQTGGNVAVNGSLNIGNQGGHGFYNISSGTLNFNSGLSTLGRTNGTSLSSGSSTGELNISGSATVNVNATSQLVLSNWYPSSGITQGSGVLNQTGGLLNVDNAAILTLTGFGHGTYNLTGGTLQIGGTSLQGVFGGQNGTYDFNLGGGTLKVSGSDLTTSVDATLVSASSSTIDTNGLNATWTGNFTGTNGQLVKKGLGNLSLSGSNTIASFFVNAGSVSQASGTTTSSEVGVGSGLTGTTPNVGVYNMAGGTLQIAAGTPPPIVGGSASSFRVGDFGGSGTFNQTGGNVAVNGSLNIGNQGGHGFYNISSGTLNFDSGLSTLGRTSGSSVSSGSSTGELNISGSATVNINGTAHLTLSNWYPASGITQGNGTLNQTGGILSVANTAMLTLTGFGAGTYNLNGGALQIGGTSLEGVFGGESGTYSFNLGGGTIKVSGTDLATNVNANLVAGTADIGPASKIDTNGLNATWSGSINGAQGGLIKTGSGTLTFDSAASRTIGYFNADQGTTRQTAGLTTSTEFVVGSNYAAKNAAFNFDGGTLTVTGSTQATPGPSFRVGDFTGSGTVNQTSGLVAITASSTAGASFHLGNEGGTGTYNISSGTLAFTGGGFITMGRSTGTRAASSGSFNISGDALADITGNGSSAKLIIGDNITSTNNGYGVINQTGGILRIRNGASLYLSGYAPTISGTDTYNLLGGALEIGGSSLNASYNGTSPYAFNLGGGTIRVIESDLTTSVAAHLAAGTADSAPASKIDTNGLNATWSGSITGAQGGLVKIGTGTLTFNGSSTRTIGYLNTDQGTTRQTAGTTTSTEFVVGSNYSVKNGTFTLDGGTVNVSGSTPASSTPSLRVGDFSGTGIFNQNAGVINADGAVVIGNRGGDGSYNLSSGTFNVGQNAIPGTTGIIIGRSRAADATGSQGSLNITGGLLHLFSGAALQIGGEDLSDARSTGVVTQSGNSQVIIEKFIQLADTGTGTYNLNGGILQIGGANGIRKGAGTATFNLAGGTLDLSSSFSTSVDLTVSGTASTIDTNAFTGTFAGSLLGSGLVTKLGAGAMLVNSTANTASIQVNEGSLSGTGKTTGNVTVASGATLAGAVNIGGTTTIEQGATFGPGFSPAAVYNDGDLVLAGTMYIELSGSAGGTGSFSAPVTGEYDQVLYGGAGGITLTDDAVLQIASLSSYLPQVGDTFDLLLASNLITANPSAITVEGVGALSDYIFYLTLGSTTWNGSGTYNAVELHVLAVPEPGTYALLVFTGTVLLMAFRRRKATALAQLN